jgi:ABC-type amino acid transport substrate-binding protein
VQPCRERPRPRARLRVVRENDLPVPPSAGPARDCAGLLVGARRAVLAACCALALGAPSAAAADRSPTEAGTGDGAAAATSAPVVPVEGSTPSPALFYFFSPDWRPPDLGRLAVAIEAALLRKGLRLSFQAFTRFEDFEREQLENKPDFLIAPAWVGDPSDSGRPSDLEVLARPVRQGRPTYRKALMTRPGVDSIDDLARGSIAATLHSMSGGSSSSLLEAFHLDGNSARVVPVPKDVDALLALRFGQVDGALVTSAQYEEFGRADPLEAAQLRLLAVSPEIPLPPLFARRGADQDSAAELRALFLGLGGEDQGSAILGLLGFDGYMAETPPASPAPRSTNGTSRPTKNSAGTRPTGRR